ncbi:MAG TPA: VWA domain-containing protein [Candidatus Kapabacteria bacterium]|jgi:WD40 repeat protein|nr:VWA domain-containing protein [Candidatus Kapabacteria bacterium]
MTKRITATAIGLLFAALAVSRAQPAAHVFSVDTTGYPSVTARLMAFDASWRRVDADAPTVTVHENGVARALVSVACEPTPSTSLSTVIAVDLSRSMIGGRLGDARAAIGTWIDNMPGASEVAITGFDARSDFYSDLTSDRTRLRDAVAGLRVGSGGDFNVALLRPPAGAFAVLERARHRRVVVIIADGVMAVRADELARRSIEEETTIYVALVGVWASDSIRALAERSGGAVIDGIEGEAEARLALRTLLELAQGGRPCELRWSSGFDCSVDRLVNIALGSGTSASVRYRAAPALTPRIALQSDAVSLGPVVPGRSAERDVTLGVINGPVHLRGVSIDAPGFTIVEGGTVDRVLEPGEVHRFRVRYAATDSLYRFARISIASDACGGDLLFAVAGYRGKRMRPQLRFVTPRDRDTLDVMRWGKVRWEGVASSDYVDVRFGSLMNKVGMDQVTGLAVDWYPTETIPHEDTLYLSESRELPYPLEQLHINRAEFSDNMAYAFTMRQRASVTELTSCRVVWTYGDSLAALYGDAQDGAFGPRGDTFAIATNRSKIVLADINRGTVIGAYDAPVTGIAYRPDGAQMATCQATNVRLLGVDASVERVIEAHAGKVHHIVYSHDGTLLATAGRDPGVPWSTFPIKLWDPRTGELVRTLDGHPTDIFGISFSPDDRMLVSASADRTATLWDVTTGARIAAIDSITEPDPRPVFDADFTPDGRQLITFVGGGLRRWDIATRRRLDTVDYDVPGGATALSPDGTLYFTTTGIRYLGNVPLGADTSLITIGTAVVTPREIPLGTIIAGEQFDTVLTDLVRNSGTAKLTVQELVPYWPRTIDIAVLSPYLIPVKTPRDTVPIGEALPVEVRVEPRAAGAYTGVFYVAAYKLLRYVSRGTAVDRPLAPQVDLVDFGAVDVNDRLDTSIAVALRNVSPSRLQLGRARIIGPDTSQFELTLGPPPGPLNVSGNLPLSIGLRPKRAGRVSSRIAFEYDGPGSPAIIQVAADITGVLGAPADGFDAAVHQVVSIAPNPASMRVDVTIDVPHAGVVRMRVVDPLGRDALPMIERRLSAGRHSISIDAAELASGSYFITLNGRSGASAVLTVIR